jgi:hypothetical protein
MGQAWKTAAAGKFFCPRCGALYEVISDGATNVGGSPECVVCRADMQLGAQASPRQPYRLIQRPEVLSD